MGGFGSVLGPHIRSVPFELLPNTQCDAAQEDDLGEIGGDIKVGIRRRAAFAAGDPLQVLPVISVLVQIVSGNGPGDGFDCFVSLAINESYQTGQPVKVRT